MCNHGQFFNAIGACSLALVISATGARAQDPLENAPLAADSMPKARESEKGTSDSATKTDAQSKANKKPAVIAKSPAEWRRILTRMQFAVTREKMTEQPFAGKYASGHFRGTFVCVCCDAAEVQSELFSSQTKFDSGTGWPSFYQAISNKGLQTAWDYSEGEPRLEVMCRRCGAHLGHVFDDGPPPTGLRFCINSASIKLVAPEGDAPSKSVSGKTSSNPRSKAKTKTSPKSAPKHSPSDESTGTTDASAAPAASNPKNE
jgi:peptide-methionine (R)-S-oxide reductase